MPKSWFLYSFSNEYTLLLFLIIRGTLFHGFVPVQRKLFLVTFGKMQIFISCRPGSVVIWTLAFNVNIPCRLGGHSLFKHLYI